MRNTGAVCRPPSGFVGCALSQLSVEIISTRSRMPTGAQYRPPKSMRHHRARALGTLPRGRQASSILRSASDYLCHPLWSVSWLFMCCFPCAASQALVEYWGELYAPGVFVPGWDADHRCTLYSSLRKFPSVGRHPLPQVNKITALLAAFARCDEASRELVTKVHSLFAREVPHCLHSNTFWFPECGPVFMDTMKPRVILCNIPSFHLCSDCGLCLAWQPASHPPRTTLP